MRTHRPGDRVLFLGAHGPWPGTVEKGEDNPNRVLVEPDLGRTTRMDPLYLAVACVCGRLPEARICRFRRYSLHCPARGCWHHPPTVSKTWTAAVAEWTKLQATRRLTPSRDGYTIL